jgi:hypothetical protein
MGNKGLTIGREAMESIDSNKKFPAKAQRYGDGSGGSLITRKPDRDNMHSFWALRH